MPKKGYKQTEEHRSINKGKIPWNKGLHIKTNTGRTHFKKGEAFWSGKERLNFRGENHPRWKGGIARDKHSLSDPLYKKWRSSVFERDDWTCKTCREKGVYLEAHHIYSWKKFPELRYDIDNGVTLCRECHKLTDNYKGKCNRINN